MRAITSDELIKLRGAQFSRLGLAFFQPTTVYTARVNQSTFDNPLAQITFDAGSGTLSDAKAGYTLLIGSTAGASDHGVARLRKDAASGVLYIGETSELTAADNDYLTVLREVDLWPRHVRLQGTTALMDYDVAYSDQHANLDPYPVLGPDQVLALPTGGTVSAAFSAVDSWVLGSTITAYSWSAPGASATANLTTATPTITYNAAGTYSVRCTVTAANGKTATGYRQVLVYSAAAPLEQDFVLDDCSGDYDEGGWSFSATVYLRSVTLRDRMKVALVASDYWEGQAAAVGPLSGRENIVAIGWIDGESIRYRPEIGTATFTVRGPHAWLRQMSGYPVGIERTSSAATNWTEMAGLTVNRGLWHVLHWRTTASLCLDASLTADTKLLPSAESPSATIWEQLITLGHESILAQPVCDRYGRLYIHEETQYLPAASRGSIPTVMALTSDDWSGDISIERAPVRTCALLELSGIRDDTEEALISRAMGGVLTRFGETATAENLLLDNQAAANELAGNYFAALNNPYPAVNLTLAQNNRFVDIAPRQRVTLSLAAGDTPLGMVWTNQPLLPRKVGWAQDAESGAVSTELELMAETSSTVSGVTVIVETPAAVGDSDIGFTLPDFDNLTWPALTPGVGFTPPPYTPLDPVVPPVSGATCPTDAPANGPYYLPLSGVIGPGNDFNSDFEYDMSAAVSVVVRTSGHGSPTTYELRGLWEKFNGTDWAETSDDSFYVVEAISTTGAVVATGVHDAVTNLRVRTGVLNAAAATQIAFIRVRLIEGSMPDTVSAVGWSWDLYPVGDGTLSWGILDDKGVWASHQNIVKEGTSRPYNTSGGGSRITVGDDGRLNGRWAQIKHSGNVMLESEYSGTYPHYAYVYTPAEGNVNGGMKWQEAIVGGVYTAYATVEHTFAQALGGTAPVIGLQIGAGAPPGTPSWKMTYNHYLTMLIIPQYRMTVSATALANVCPIEG